MSRTKDIYTIPFRSLKEGVIDEVWNIGKEFIEGQELEDVKDANLAVSVHFVKQIQLHTLSITMKGTVTVICDRCLDDFQLHIVSSRELVVKQGDADDELSDAENMLVVSPEMTELELSPILREMILLALPLKKVHSNEKDCNAEMLSYLKQSEKRQQKEKEVDPRWDSLKNMFKN